MEFFFTLQSALGKKIIAFMSEDFKYIAVLSLSIDRFRVLLWQLEPSVLKMELAIDNEQFKFPLCR